VRNPRLGGSRPATRRVPAASRPRHPWLVRTRRGPSAIARCAVVGAAALIAAAAPAGVRAGDFEQLAGLADRIQAETWSRVAPAPQPSGTDLAQRITDATQAAVDAAIADASRAAVVVQAKGRGDSPKEAPRASAQQVPRARVHEKARPRHAAAAASPTLPARPPAQIEVQPPPKPRAAKRPEPAGAARGSPAPSIPFDLPSIPLPFAVPSSAGAASGGGSPVPPLLVALATALSLFVTEVVIRRVPSRRPVRPRRIVLPTWRPG
jgi:hypothetical protein